MDDFSTATADALSGADDNVGGGSALSDFSFDTGSIDRLLSLVAGSYGRLALQGKLNSKTALQMLLSQIDGGTLGQLLESGTAGDTGSAATASNGARASESQLAAMMLRLMARGKRNL